MVRTVIILIFSIQLCRGGVSPSDPPVSINSEKPLLTKHVVWDSAEEEDIFGYFVYGLTVTRDGSILVFSEARIESSDHGAHHIALRRSVDNGNSFSPSEILVESVAGASWANPTPVVDSSTGKVFLFYALNQGNVSSRVFYVVSDDDGINWAAPREVTSLFEPNAHDWTFHLPGPGHGIQLSNGRLLVPVWHRKSISYSALERQYGVNSLYSDDGGLSWQVGEDTPVGQLNESQFVEKSNGDVLMIGRTYTSLNGSWQAQLTSKDGGVTWLQTMQYDEGLKGSVCDIGLTRISYHPNMILVSQPGHPERRADLTVRLSTDEGLSWSLSKLLEPGPATYSDLALLSDGTIICLYGHGRGKNNHIPKKVTLARFNLQWLLSASE